MLLTYVGNTHHEGFQPRTVGIDKLVYEMLSRKEHFFHKAPIVGMGQDIGFQYKPYFQDSHYRADIHLFLLKFYEILNMMCQI